MPLWTASFLWYFHCTVIAVKLADNVCKHMGSGLCAWQVCTWQHIFTDDWLVVKSKHINKHLCYLIGNPLRGCASISVEPATTSFIGSSAFKVRFQRSWQMFPGLLIELECSDQSWRGEGATLVKVTPYPHRHQKFRSLCFGDFIVKASQFLQSCD